MEKEKVDVSKVILESISRRPVVLVEVRGQVCDTIKYVDQKTGKPAEMHKTAVAAEFAIGGAQITLEYLPPKGETAAAPLPYKKGDLIIVELSGYSDTREGGRKGRIVNHQLFKSV